MIYTYWASVAPIHPHEVACEWSQPDMAPFRFLRTDNPLRTQGEVPRGSNPNRRNRLQRGVLASSV